MAFDVDKFLEEHAKAHPTDPAMGGDSPTEVIETVSHAHEEHGTVTVPTPPSNVTRSNIWRHPDAHPIALDVMLLREYGPEWMVWEAETLRVRIPEDFKTQSLSELNLSKLQAVRTLHLVDSYWERWEVFLACTGSFNNEFPDFETMQVPTVAKCLVSCDVAARIRDDVAWSEELKLYVGGVYWHDGIFMKLPPADFAVFTIPEDIHPDEVQKRWVEAKMRDRLPTENTVVAEQVRRIATVTGFLEESRHRLATQLRLLSPHA